MSEAAEGEVQVDDCLDYLVVVLHVGYLCPEKVFLSLALVGRLQVVAIQQLQQLALRIREPCLDGTVVAYGAQHVSKLGHLAYLEAVLLYYPRNRKR